MPMTLRRLFWNHLSLIGGIIAAMSFTVNVFLLLLDFLSPTQNPYVGIITYMLLPGITLGGLGLFFGGAALQFWRRRHGIEVVELPRLDLNDPRHRLGLIGTFVLLFVFLGLSAIGGYESYHYTDSVAFCGKTCHTVMQPEYTAYQQSPHARVACVSCHIGPGAEWFVRAKISGAYQVYSVLFNKFSRPIATPIHNLRPAQDVCEQCHWPAKFWGEQLAARVHFGSDEKNTRREIDLLIKTGGGSELGVNAGIHWHMNINNKIWYAAADARRQVIPWVRSQGPDGRVTEYVTTEKPLTADQLKTAEIRRMDCIDCHTRPSHRYLPPGRALDASLQSGRIFADLPFIKKVAVVALVASYATAEEADRGIAKYLREFYQKEYPALAQTQAQRLEAAVAEVKRVYHLNFFPEMRVSWQAYPDNIGHKEFPGCFRCHDGKHVSADGKMISRNCSACHEFLERGAGGSLVRTAATPAFAHPWKLAGKHAELLCGTCHSGGPAKPATCRGCHAIPDSGVPMAGMQCKQCHLKEQQVKPLVNCAVCHSVLAGLHQKQPHKVAGCAACHAPHRWKIEGRERCLTCHGDRAQHNPGPPCAECHAFRTAGGKAAGAPPSISFPADPNSPGPVTFVHAKHLATGAKCADCHPKLFKMQKGGDKLSMDAMGEGKLCGACHDGTKAFGVMDGDKCLTCHKGS